MSPPATTAGTCVGYTGSIRPCPAERTVGFDCSGLTRYAYYKAFGRDVNNGATGTQVRWVSDSTLACQATWPPSWTELEATAKISVALSGTAFQLACYASKRPAVQLDCQCRPARQAVRRVGVRGRLTPLFADGSSRKRRSLFRKPCRRRRA